MKQCMQARTLRTCERGASFQQMGEDKVAFLSFQDGCTTHHGGYLSKDCPLGSICQNGFNLIEIFHLSEWFQFN